ncbi:MAG TPA: hypothetical protein VGJ54_04845, partial [Streptosporangiaceae bacterium]
MRAAAGRRTVALLSALVTAITPPAAAAASAPPAAAAGPRQAANPGAAAGLHQAADPRPAAGPLPPGVEVRGWNILSKSNAGADTVIAASRGYRINQIQLSHQIVHHLREIRDADRRKQVNRLTDAAHAAGATEVVVWDHSLYDLDYYPDRFRTGPGHTIDLDNPAFWTWFRQDYRNLLNLVPKVDAVALTFIETGARVEQQ